MLFPVIVVKDKSTGKEHIVGSDIHDSLILEDSGTLMYRNLQNGEGSGEFGAYEFVSNDTDAEEAGIRFVTMEELMKIYKSNLTSKRKTIEASRELIESMFEDEDDSGDDI